MKPQARLIELKKNLSTLVSDKTIGRFVKLFILISILFVSIVFLLWKYLPPQLPLFYSLPRGNEQLGTPQQLLLLPFLSIFLFCINLIFASYSIRDNKLFSLILILIGVVTNIILFIACIKIIMLVV